MAKRSTRCRRERTGRGWELHKKTYQVTIDNRQYAGNFNFLLDGQAAMVPAGQSQAYHSPYPIEIAFDCGNGETARKRLSDGTYHVGLDAAHQQLDLFPGGTQMATAPSLRAIR